MKRLLLILLLSWPLPTLAQMTIDTLHWSATRRLHLADFHALTQPGLGGSEFHYQIGYDVRPTFIWGTPAIQSFCLMFRNLSWISETARNERTLAYNQVLFDLVEVYTRQMKAKLIALEMDKQFRQQAKQIEYLTNSDLGAEVNRFRSETGGGDDLPALQRWEERVVKRLRDTPDLITTYTSSKVGYGLFAGGNGSIATGALAETLGPAAGLSFGLDVALRRTMFMVHPTLCLATLQQGFSYHNQSWETGMPIRSRSVEVSLGRVVYDGPRSRWIPYVGYRLLALSARRGADERYNGLSVINHTPAVGVVLDIKLGDNTHKPDRSEDTFWFVRTKLSYSPMVDKTPFSGGLLNLQIGLGGFGRIRKVSYQPHYTTVVLPGGIR